MAHKFDPQNKKKLDNEERKKIFPAEAAVGIFGCESGEYVADIGCGTGYLTIPAAKVVGPYGMVYGYDTSERMLEGLRERTGKLGLENIKLFLSEEYSLPLPHKECSRALMSSVFHEVDDRVRFAKAAAEILIPEGVLTILEMKPGVDGPGPPDHHRIASGIVEADLEKAGFEIIDSGDMNEYFYYVKGRKR